MPGHWSQNHTEPLGLEIEHCTVEWWRVVERVFPSRALEMVRPFVEFLALQKGSMGKVSVASGILKLIPPGPGSTLDTDTGSSRE